MSHLSRPGTPTNIGSIGLRRQPAVAGRPGGGAVSDHRRPRPRVGAAYVDQRQHQRDRTDAGLRPGAPQERHPANHAYMVRINGGRANVELVSVSSSEASLAIDTAAAHWGEST